jgi:hypothetical protein
MIKKLDPRERHESLILGDVVWASSRQAGREGASTGVPQDCPLTATRSRMADGARDTLPCLDAPCYELLACERSAQVNQSKIGDREGWVGQPLMTWSKLT